jgi:hypothetical protein
MPLRFNYDDVGTPYEGDPCGCHELYGDGMMDLTMHYETQALVEGLMLDQVMGGEDVQIVLSGTLWDGTPFTAVDCFWFVPNAGFGIVPAPDSE